MDDQSVALPGEAVALGDERCHSLQSFIAELGDPAADDAEQVLVVRYAARRLEALESLSEIPFYHEPATYQKLQGAIDGRRASSGALLTQLATNVFSRQVAVRLEHSPGNRQALGRDRQAVIAQVGPEQVLPFGPDRFADYSS